MRKRIATYGTRGKLVRVDDVTEHGTRKYEVITGSKAKNLKAGANAKKAVARLLTELKTRNEN